MRIERGDTGKEVPGEIVSSRGRGAKGTVGGQHVVDGRLVDAVVGYADNSGKYDGGDPVRLVGAEAGPGEAEEADW